MNGSKLEKVNFDFFPHVQENESEETRNLSYFIFIIVTTDNKQMNKHCVSS